MSGDPFASTKQPLKTNRTYMPATWAAVGMGGGHPKLAGGEEETRQGTGSPPRGFNRPQQIYAESEATLQAKRVTRATAEYGSTVIAQAAFGLIMFRSTSGAYYYTAADGTLCNCPDKWRLASSGKVDVNCKHELMAQTAIADYSGYDFLPWSTSRLAEVLGVAESTAAKLCLNGTIPATKFGQTWLIVPDAPTTEAINEYIAKNVNRAQMYVPETEE